MDVDDSTWRQEGWHLRTPANRSKRASPKILDEKATTLASHNGIGFTPDIPIGAHGLRRCGGWLRSEVKIFPLHGTRRRRRTPIDGRRPSLWFAVEGPERRRGVSMPFLTRQVVWGWRTR